MSVGDLETKNSRDIKALSRGVRYDLVIAISALLVSSVAAIASWTQVRVVRQNFNAQIWPYVSVEGTVNGDTAEFAFVNAGLGPAVLHSAQLSVDKRPVDFIGMMHAILGPNIVARAQRSKEKIDLLLRNPGPGGVLRPGQSKTVFALTSRHFANALLHGEIRAGRNAHLLLRDHTGRVLAGRLEFAFRSSTTRRVPRDKGRSAPCGLRQAIGLAVLAWIERQSRRSPKTTAL